MTRVFSAIARAVLLREGIHAMLLGCFPLPLEAPSPKSEMFWRVILTRRIDGGVVAKAVAQKTD